MRGAGVSEEQARDEISLIDETWKKMNKYWASYIQKHSQNQPTAIFKLESNFAQRISYNLSFLIVVPNKLI